MSHNPQKLKRCPACEGIRGQDHLPDCFTVAANKLWSNLNVLLTSPVSQPDGYAGESQAITPEPERNAFTGQPYDTQPKEDGSYERVPRAGTPTPLYRAVLGPDGIPSLELVSDSPTAREIALEERLQQAHETIAQQFNTIETLKLVVSELKAGRNVMHLLDSLILRSKADRTNRGAIEQHKSQERLDKLVERTSKAEQENVALRAKVAKLEAPVSAAEVEEFFHKDDWGAPCVYKYEFERVIAARGRKPDREVQ